MGLLIFNSKDSEEKWLQARQNYLTASDVSAAMGESSFKTPAELVADKLYGSNFKGNRKTWWGQFEEENLVRLFLKLGVEVEYDGGLYALEGTRLAATLDARSTGRKLDVPAVDLSKVTSEPSLLARAIAAATSRPCIVEFKCSEVFQAKTWKVGPPSYYVTQVQAQLAVSGLRTALLAARLGAHDLIVHIIEADPATQTRCIRQANATMATVDAARRGLEDC